MFGDLQAFSVDSANSLWKATQILALSFVFFGGLALLVRPRRTPRTPPAASVPGPALAADTHGQL